MAVTKFKELHPFMRTFLNDLKDHFKIFSDSELDSFISTFTAIEGTPVQDGRRMQFTTEIVAVQDKALLSAKISLNVLEHQDTYRFSTRILSVGDSAGDLTRRINSLVDIIDRVENGGSDLAVDSDGDFRAIFGIEARNNTINDINDDFSRPAERLN